MNRLCFGVVLFLTTALLLSAQQGARIFSGPGGNPQDGPVNLILTRFLDTNGDGTGTKNAIGDYSGGEIFYIQPSSTQIFRVARLVVHYEDVAGMVGEEYGNLGSALTNGIIVRVQDDSGTIIDLIDNEPIQTNADWGRFCYDVVVNNFSASGASANDHALVRWSFFKSESIIRIDGSANERFEIVLSDNFTGLIEQFFLVQGYIEETGT